MDTNELFQSMMPIQANFLRASNWRSREKKKIINMTNYIIIQTVHTNCKSLYKLYKQNAHTQTVHIIVEVQANLRIIYNE